MYTIASAALGKGESLKCPVVLLVEEPWETERRHPNFTGRPLFRRQSAAACAIISVWKCLFHGWQEIGHSVECRALCGDQSCGLQLSTVEPVRVNDLQVWI